MNDISDLTAKSASVDFSLDENTDDEYQLALPHSQQKVLR
jgi:hypothetical protein